MSAFKSAFAKPAREVPPPVTPVSTTHTGTPIVTGARTPLDKPTESCLTTMANGQSYLESQLWKYGHGNGDLPKLMRMGYIEMGAQQRNRRTGRDEDTYKITSKGLAALGGQGKTVSKPTGISPGRLARSLGEDAETAPEIKVYAQSRSTEGARNMATMLVRSGRVRSENDLDVVHIRKVPGADREKGQWCVIPAGMVLDEAYQNDPNSSVDDEQGEQSQNGFATPQGQPHATQQAAPAPTTPQPPQAPKSGQQQAPQPQQAATVKPAQPQQQAQGTGPQPNAAQATPTGTQQPNTAPTPASANDMAAAKQIADKIKSGPGYNSANLDGDIQKSITAMGKAGPNSSNLTNLVKQQMGVAESIRTGRNSK